MMKLIEACAGYLEYPFQNSASIGAFVISVLQQLL